MSKANNRLSKANNSGLLINLLASRRRAEVFRLLFGLSQRELYVREMERLSGLKVATIQVELRALHKMGLVTARRDGNRLYYRADASHPVFPEIHGLVIKTAGLIEVLQDRLRGAAVEVAFVFGSIARGEETGASDIDVFIIGDLGLRDVSPLLSGLTDVVFREVNPYVISVDEFARRVKRKEHFVTSVLASAKLFIIGDDGKLEELGK